MLHQFLSPRAGGGLGQDSRPRGNDNLNAPELALEFFTFDYCLSTAVFYPAAAQSLRHSFEIPKATFTPKLEEQLSRSLQEHFPGAALVVDKRAARERIHSDSVTVEVTLNLGKNQESLPLLQALKEHMKPFTGEKSPLR